MVVVLCGSNLGSAEDLLPANTEITIAINHYVHQQLVASEVAAVELADDLTLLRRTTLDLGGRVPTPVERDWFISQPASDRRRLLVDRLMCCGWRLRCCHHCLLMRVRLFHCLCRPAGGLGGASPPEQPGRC